MIPQKKKKVSGATRSISSAGRHCCEIYTVKTACYGQQCSSLHKKVHQHWTRCYTLVITSNSCQQIKLTAAILSIIPAKCGPGVTGPINVHDIQSHYRHSQLKRALLTLRSKPIWQYMNICLLEEKINSSHQTLCMAQLQIKWRIVALRTVHAKCSNDAFWFFKSKNNNLKSMH